MIFYPSKVYTYFSNNYVLGKRSPKGWRAMDCPFCGKEKKGAVSIDAQFYKCWSCGAAANVAEFVEQIENVDYYQAKQIINSCKPSPFDLEAVADIVATTAVNNITLPDGWQSILDGVGMLGDRARRYLEDRGYDLEALDFKGFGYCNKHHEEPSKDFFGYIIVPFRKDGALAYYLGRDYIGNYLRYKNPPSDWVGVGKADVIYNEEALHLYKTIFIVEGWSDAEMIGKKGTATLGWSLSNTQLSKYHKSDSNKVLIPDAGTDEATGQTYYQKAVQTATHFLEGKNKVFVVDLNVPEFDHIKNAKGERAKDICEIGWELVYKQYKKTEQLTWNKAMQIITQ